MNKKVTVVLIILALALIAYNVTIIDFSDLLGEESIIAVIGVVAAMCAIVLLLILLTSRNIQKKIDEE
jgi:NADH:ubiquinone oxidoreductase subunit K